tara:strand:- start:787 stop:1158 length:372 start_codon:yes stop_codon:yes gene_type:complete
MIAAAIFFLGMAILRIIFFDYENFPGSGLSVEELSSWKSRTIDPTMYLTLLYFIYRYFIGKNPTSTIWPVYVVTICFSFTQFVALFTFDKVNLFMLINLLITVAAVFIFRIAHNRRKKEVSTF